MWSRLSPYWDIPYLGKSGSRFQMQSMIPHSQILHWRGCISSQKFKSPSYEIKWNHSDQFQTLICCSSLRISVILKVSEQLKQAAYYLKCLKLVVLLMNFYKLNQTWFIHFNCGCFLCASLWYNTSELELQTWIPSATALTFVLSSEKFPSWCHFPSL